MRGLGMCVVILLGGCTRLNPGFLDTARGGTSDGDTSVTAADTADNGIDDSAGSDSSDSSGATATAGTTGDGDADGGDGDGSCSVPVEPDYVLRLETGPGGEPLDCGLFDWDGDGGQHMIYSATINGFVQLTGPCDETCENCAPRLHELSVSPNGFEDDMPTEPLCMIIVAEGDLSNPAPNVCDWAAISFFRTDPTLGDIPTGAISLWDWGVPWAIDYVADAVQDPFTIDLGLVDECACTAGTCCDPDNPPATYKLELADGQFAYEGNTVTTPWFFSDYNVTNLASVDDGSCPNDKQIAWAMAQATAGGPSVRR